MKRLTSFTHLKTGEGDRIAFTYSDVNSAGTIVNQNVKENFIIVDEDLQGHIDAVCNFIRKNKLEDK